MDLNVPVLIPVGGVALVLLVINVKFAFSFMDVQKKKIDTQDGESEKLKLELAKLREIHREEILELNKEVLSWHRRHLRCEQRTNMLIFSLTRSGIEVPKEIWDLENPENV